MPLSNSDCWKTVVAVAIPNVGGFAAAHITRRAVKGWYQKLNFPPGRPADWVFAPMWTSLYCGMGYASYLVWKNGGGFEGEAQLPLIVYGSQLALNWAWSPIFFMKKDFKLVRFESRSLVSNRLTSRAPCVCRRPSSWALLPLPPERVRTCSTRSTRRPVSFSFLTWRGCPTLPTCRTASIRGTRAKSKTNRAGWARFYSTTIKYRTL